MNNLTQQMENDQTDIVDRTSNVNSLSTQVKKLESAQRNLETQEENLRLIKRPGITAINFIDSQHFITGHIDGAVMRWMIE